jgi:L-asparaginase II
VSGGNDIRPLDAAGAVELAVLERSGLIESRHLGAAVVVGPDGSVLRELGDSAAIVYPRSSLKPLQAMAVLRSGTPIDGERLALASASHAGTPRHVAVARDILAAAGLAETALQCPPDWPLDRDAAFDVRSAGHGKRSITMNCSGKHASFLLACAHNGWSIDDYLEPSHPLQQLVRSTVEELTGESVRHSGIDGCGAPVFALTLRGLAAGVGRVARAGSTARGPELDADAARLASAILANPWAIDGPGRPNAVVIERLGLIVKGGAEGVIVAAAPDGTAVAIKMLDGNKRATTMVALELLGSVGAVDLPLARAIAAELVEPVLGRGIPVGSLRVSDLI